MGNKVQYCATGRRKLAVARVRLIPGEGNIIVNRKVISDYFGRDTLSMIVKQPMELTSTVDKYDVMVNVCGGGSSGQAGAIRHGISRALLKIDPDLRKPLRQAGYLTRDPRMKERKKYGLKGARARFQFSKR